MSNGVIYESVKKFIIIIPYCYALLALYKDIKQKVKNQKNQKVRKFIISLMLINSY